MIRSYGDRETRDVAFGLDVRRFRGIAGQAQRRLQLLNAAGSLDELRRVRGNRLEALRGDLAGFYSIRINRQWRLVFRWEGRADGPEDVTIMDYH
jgi:toxin HigB-1